MLCGMNDAFGVFTESFADAAPTDWKMSVLGFDSGDTDLRGPNIPDMLGETATGINIDLLSVSDKHTGWGIFDADATATLGQEKPWTILDLPAGNKVHGNTSPPGWDATAWLDRVLDAGLTNSNLSSAWNPGRLVTDGSDFGRNNIYLDNIAAIPEPATYGLITIFGGGILLFRRRFKL